MNKFNRPRRNIARERRFKRAEKRKLALTKSSASTSGGTVSGKRQRKILKKWRKAQKEALETGLVTMEDIEMIAADGEGPVNEETSKVKPPPNKRVFTVKMKAKMRAKIACKGKKKKTEATASDMDGDTMMQ